PREQKIIPIISDEHVDFEFGTGVLKVTPAHDKADFEIGLRPKLPVVDVLNPDGTMNELAGNDLKGLDRFKARKLAAEKLAELGALDKEEPYTNNVGFSERADVPIEPRLSEQWFLKYPSVEASRSVVAEGRMKFFPDRWAKVYEHWMSNIQDWCISRQLWWRHRIPVWSKTLTDAELKSFERAATSLRVDENNHPLGFTVSISGKAGEESFFSPQGQPSEDKGLVFVSTDSPEELRELERRGFTQDPDVLDTWFSSWLWPFATMGWPEQTP